MTSRECSIILILKIHEEKGEMIHMNKLIRNKGTRFQRKLKRHELNLIFNAMDSSQSLGNYRRSWNLKKQVVASEHN